VWTGTTKYVKHAMVTHDGNLWIGKSASIATRPGTSPAWQLAVRKGRDAKRLREDTEAPDAAR
jgi:hypothetical protein